MSNSGRIALSGIITALSLVCMMLTGLITIGTYSLPALAGLFLIIPSIEISRRWAFTIYIAVSVLSIFLVVDKEASIIFILLFGYYPILKTKIEKLNNNIVEYILKLFICNTAMILLFFITVKLLGVPEESFEIFGLYLTWVFLILGNIIFIIYDYAINDIFSLYYKKFHNNIRKMLR